MLKSYEAKRFRLINPNDSMREGVASHRYNAVDDADAVSAAKALHAGLYEPSVDEIVVYELIPGEQDRFITFISGPL